MKFKEIIENVAIVFKEIRVSVARKDSPPETILYDPVLVKSRPKWQDLEKYLEFNVNTIKSDTGRKLVFLLSEPD